MLEPWYVTFQPAIAAGIGFSGVIATLVTNGILQRRGERVRQIARRETVRSAILGELHMIDRAVQRSKYSFDNDKTKMEYYISNIKIFEGTIFNGVINDIGALDKEEAMKVAEAYVVCRQTPQFLVLATGGQLVNGFIHAPAAKYEVVRGVLQGTQDAVREAISTLGDDTMNETPPGRAT